MRNLLIICLMSILVIISGCTSSKENKDLTNTSNISNGSMFDVHEGLIHFMEPDRGLYRLDNDLKDRKLVMEGNYSTINIQDEWIYTKIASGIEKGIYRLNVDNLDTEKLTDIPGSYIHKKDNLLFFSYDGIYVLDIENKETVKISDNRGRFLGTYEDHLFYSNESDEGKIYQFNINTGREEQLTDRTCTFMVVENEFMYYVEDNRIHRFNIKNGIREAIEMDMDGLIQYIGVKEGVIYAVVKDMDRPKSRLYKITEDKEEILLVEGSNISNMNIVKDNLIFKDGTNFYCIALNTNEVSELDF